MSTQTTTSAYAHRPTTLKAALAASVAILLLAGSQSAMASSSSKHGIQFECDDYYSSYFIDRYLTSQGIKKSWVHQERTANGWIYKIKQKYAVESTLDIAKSDQFSVGADIVEILDPRRQPKMTPTVSKKEILLSMLHPGRLTTFKGAKCGVEALKDDVGVRQTTVAWAQTVAFGWPEGTPAKWNTKYWLKGTPKNKESLHEALTDATINSGQYEIGCYTAAKIILSAGALDYYTRVKKDPFKAKQVEMALWSDGDPLVDIEPGRAWFFESTFKESDRKIPGKILDMKDDVASGNFIPGDWIYLLNTDAKSYQKTGYEGSNAIYLGMGKFSDYYNDHEHSFSFQQKSNEVYQWRNGVFSRSRDAAKVRPLTADDYERLRKSPGDGGILLAHRLVPRQLNPVVK